MAKIMSMTDKISRQIINICGYLLSADNKYFNTRLLTGRVW